ncbi:hypothetical protein G7054_g14439 [Neopestalotiopsis clavispora]|nr:hypothetical protein E8E14_007469 [Neopestalotiopsis sp. 37M]KAF7515734.1 hypothetical protein G7054_g14439 [Neopestalotiopsis clavispora]
MSPPMQLTSHLNTPYTPTSDALDRHDYGISKNRKLVSTGGGRAWSEDEEVYLLQTRLQKMPYKHIAAHLKKTELACRLHYHQLSHGSNRRKRTTSVSSASSSGHSPILPAIVPSPINECSSRDSTPPQSAYGPGSPGPVHLPSIMANTNTSPRLPAILPKPAAMNLTNTAMSPNLGYPTPTLADTARCLGPSAFPQPSPMTQATAPLRLDCTLPPPTAHVDMPRLQSIYSAHRSSFWHTIANDYGTGASPIVLEQAWKANILTAGSQTPITPMASPNERDLIYEKQDKTRISAILGIDANPRSPKEREMVRLLEEGRNSAVMAIA